jgi:hypothetical protein
MNESKSVEIFNTVNGNKRIIKRLNKQKLGMPLFQKLTFTPFVGARVRYAAFSKINYNAVSWSESSVCSFF